MGNVKKVKSKKGKHYNWLMGADMYLAAAVLLTREMKNSFLVFPAGIQQIDKKCGFTSRNPDYEMLIPVIFNFKHGIELYLKAFIMQVNKNEEYPASHDLLELSNELSQELLFKKEKRLVQLIEADVKPIIKKYYYGTYAFSEYEICPDLNNEAERYPEQRNEKCYNIDKLYEVVDNLLLENIENDLVVIQEIFREKILKELWK